MGEGLISQTNEELKTLSKNNPAKELCKDMNGRFSKNEIYMASSHMKKKNKGSLTVRVLNKN